jgi:hypothetical protein
MINKGTKGFKLCSSFQAIKSAFRQSELWRPRENKVYKEWLDFKEAKRRELEIFLRDETLWQKIVRIVTGKSPLSSRLTESGSEQTKY